jgi:hypothetical protein
MFVPDSIAFTDHCSSIKHPQVTADIGHVPG